MHTSPLLGPQCSTHLDIASGKEKWLGDLPVEQPSHTALSTWSVCMVEKQVKEQTEETTIGVRWIFAEHFPCACYLDGSQPKEKVSVFPQAGSSNLAG